ncbi:hypothetical protein GQ53DRAFT_632963 [Thozetella sp. PMI_491]|nr:hypothetical protein GQ53DRAFT_632963 [Thozetella sp. PMI_491]
MDKSVSPPHVPGFGGIPLDEELSISDRFAHGFREWKQVPAITQRELVMVAVMNELTDNARWHIAIFSQDVVQRWRDEIFASRPLMSEKAWEWCVAELRDKAAYLKEKGHLRVLDTGSCVCKSDVLDGQELCADFQSGLQPILVKREGTGSDGVSTYVDPALYPLVWGKSRVLAHDGQVTLQGDIASSPNFTTERAPEHIDKRTHSDEVQKRMGTTRPRPWEHVFEEEDFGNLGAYLWSYKYQWLPSDVQFTKPSGTDMRLTSYVNDLSPAHASLYESLGKLISLSVELWNDCLIRGQTRWDDSWVKLPKGWAPPGNVREQRGRVPCRIITYGLDWENEAPEWAPLFDAVRRSRLGIYLGKQASIEAIKQGKPPKDADRRTKIKYKLRLKEAQWNARGYDDMEDVEPLPEPTPEQWIQAKEYLERPEPGSDVTTALPEEWEQDVGRLLNQKIQRLVHYRHPEPGSAFSYDEWKSGAHGGRAIVDMVTDRPIKPNATPPKTPHEPYIVCLQDRFRSQGLQVIIRIEGISLSPEKPEYVGSAWDLCGQKNEHIVATAMFAYDVQNVTQSHISFRQETNVGEGLFYWGPALYSNRKFTSAYQEPAHRRYKRGEFEGICEVFGFNPLQMCRDFHNFALPIQEIGRVALSQGRLITFPNTMEYRREPFRLKDTTKLGHHRSVTLMLVDPNYRVCSTRSVPPQWERKHDEERQNEGCFSKEEAEAYKKQMETEHAWMQYARYHMMKRFFLC